MTTAWEPPQKFDVYEIERRLGEGAMGHVYLARDIKLDRKVAVKFIREIAPDDEMLQMFSQEAQALARLAHPNVVAVHRMGELEDKPYIDSEYVDGQSLESLPKPVPWKEALRLGIDLARGLGAAHKQNVLHRDVKPANAIIDKNGTVKLLDFGIAKILDAVRHIENPADTERKAQAQVLRSKPDSSFAADSTETSPNFVVSPALNADPADMNRTLVSGSAPTASKLPRVPADFHELPESRMRGTPFYMAPELWRGKKASPRSDIYSLGVVLYELCTGRPPHAKAGLHELVSAVLLSDIPLLDDLVDGIDTEFSAIVHRCLEREPEARYASGTELANALEDLRQRLEGTPSEPIVLPSLRLSGNPYRGLLPFEAAHQSLFFGRESEVSAMLERLLKNKVLIVAGDSGVGKSSLCKAGVLPVLAEHLAEEKSAWICVSVVPGKDPVQSLLAALAQALKLNEHRLSFQLASNPEQVVREIEHKLGEGAGLILFIDQLEELITLSLPEQAKIAESLITLLLERIASMRLLATVRADFLGKIAGFMQIGRVLPRTLFFPRKMTPAQIREAIVGPARSRNVEFESEELIESLIEYTANADSGLPLLQFALSELWEARSPGAGIITKDALKGIGGVGGALARHADQVVLGLSEDARQSARRILTSLVTADGARARRSKKDLLWSDPNAPAVLSILEKARLLVPLTSESGIEYQLAHDVLIKEWETLQGWLADRVKSRAVRENIRKDAMEWDRLLREDDPHRARELLWRTRRLAEAANIDVEALSPVEKSFILASRKSDRWAKALRRALYVGIPAALILGYGAFELKARAEQERVREDIARDIDARMGEAKEILLEAQGLKEAFSKASKEAIQAFHKDFAEGERQWEDVREQAPAVDRRYADAIQKLEAAFLKDASRSDLKKALAAAYFQRILLAEELDQNPGPWIARLELYDESSEYRSKLSAPGHIHLRVRPQGARVSVERFIQDNKGAWATESAGIDWSENFSDMRLPAGSYRLIVQNKGFATLLYPLVLRRGEELDIKLEMPQASSLPEGFLYIPEGRFRFGGASMHAADDRFRRIFLATVPEHEAETGSFLIARHETTYGEWIQYLDALPLAKREQWNKRGMQSGVRGMVGLVRSKDASWELSLTVHGVEYRAGTGEPIRYKGRSKHAEQDWLQFPVMGIHAFEAEAYAKWLSDSGKVPGARLCTEKEWERVARGADRRLYAHGDNLASNDANFQDTYLNEEGSMAVMGPDAVGTYAQTRSPFGADDMVGNVFEWVRSSFPGGSHVLRGGGYVFDRASNLSMNRNTVDPKLSDPNGGLRVCADLTRK